MKKKILNNDNNKNFTNLYGHYGQSVIVLDMVYTIIYVYILIFCEVMRSFTVGLRSRKQSHFQNLQKSISGVRSRSNNSSRVLVYPNESECSWGTRKFSGMRPRDLNRTNSKKMGMFVQLYILSTDYKH